MLEWQTEFSGFVSTATLTGSRTTTDIQNGTLDSSNGITATWNLNYDWFTFHIAHSEAEVTLDIEQLSLVAEGLAQFPGVTQDAIDAMLFESDKGSFDGIGVAIDTGKVFAVAEYTETGSEGAAPDPTKNWYVSGGFRSGKWTTYLTYENAKGDLKEDDLAALTDPLVPFLGIPQVQQLFDGVNTLYMQNVRDSDTYSIGLRYDFHPSAAMKFEYIQQDDKINDVEPSAIAVAIDLVY